MAIVAPLLTDIEPLTGITNVTVPARTGDTIQYVFAVEQNDVVNFIPPASGTPSNIDLTLMSYGLDTTATPSNPITFNFQGVDITATVPAAIMPLVTVPDAGDGTGLPSGYSAGTGAIQFQAIDPFFTPADEPNCIAAFDAFDAVTSPSFSIPSVVGSNTLQVRSGANPPTIDSTTGAIFFNKTNSECLELATEIDVTTLWTFFVFETYDVIGTSETLMSGANVGTTFNGVMRSSAPFDRRGFGGDDGIYWTGQTDGSGNPVLQTLEDQFFENDGATALNSESNWWFLVEGNTSSNVKILFAASSDGTTTGRFGGGKLHYLSFHSQKPSDADIQKLQGFAAWLLADRIAAFSASDRLPSNHPFFSDRPLSVSGGGASGVSLVVPVVSYVRAISGAPAGATLGIFKRSSSLTADRSQFTLASGNNSGNSTLVVAETIPNDTPSSGFVRVLRDDGTEDRLAFSSWSGSTFTLNSVTLPATYSSGNGAYVGYIDVIGSATGTETVSLEYVADRACVLRVRLGSGGGRSEPIEQNITLGAADFEFQVSAIADTINTYS